MAKAVQRWQSNSANYFDTEHDALLDDFRGFMIDSKAVNEASATEVMRSLTTPRDRLIELQTLINRLVDTHPETPVLKTALDNDHDKFAKRIHL